MRGIVVLFCLVAWAGSALAQAHSPLCHVNRAGAALGDLGWDEGEMLRAPGSKVLDEDMRELEELGHGAVVKGDEVADMVAFTFDDGPKAETTPKVLAALARYDVPATFFVVGWRFAGERASTREHAGLLREILAAGHLIGNHTYRHVNLAAAKTEVMRREIDDNTRALEEHLGYRPHAFRPPYGAVSDRVRQHLAREGLTEVRWAVDTLDFQPGSMSTLRKRTLEKILAKRGGVVLMHDTKEATARHIAGILDDLEAENCRRLERQSAAAAAAAAAAADADDADADADAIRAKEAPFFSKILKSSPEPPSNPLISHEVLGSESSPGTFFSAIDADAAADAAADADAAGRDKDKGRGDGKAKARGRVKAKAEERPIIPVSIHYFIRERDGTPRPVPAHVAARTAQYRASLPARCAARAAARDGKPR